jgi:uncharacterized protein
MYLCFMKQLGIVVLLILSFSAFAQPKIPTMTSLVYDETGSLSKNEVNILAKKLRTFEDSTTAQVGIMIVNSLGGLTAMEFAVEAANKNHLGQEDKHNGVLILLSIGDRKWFIATGYGFESTITDDEAGQIGEEELIPSIKEGKFYAALNHTTDAIFDEIRKGPNVTRVRKDVQKK